MQQNCIEVDAQRLDGKVCFDQKAKTADGSDLLVGESPGILIPRGLRLP